MKKDIRQRISKLEDADNRTEGMPVIDARYYSRLRELLQARRSTQPSAQPSPPAPITIESLTKSIAALRARANEPSLPPVVTDYRAIRLRMAEKLERQLEQLRGTEPVDQTEKGEADARSSIP